MKKRLISLVLLSSISLSTTGCVSALSIGQNDSVCQDCYKNNGICLDSITIAQNKDELIAIQAKRQTFNYKKRIQKIEEKEYKKSIGEEIEEEEVNQTLRKLQKIGELE
jgi:hypothetical protein